MALFSDADGGSRLGNSVEFGNDDRIHDSATMSRLKISIDHMGSMSHTSVTAPEIISPTLPSPTTRVSPKQGFIDWKRSLSAFEIAFLELHDAPHDVEGERQCNFCKKIIDSNFMKSSDQNKLIKVWNCSHSKMYHSCCYTQMMKNAGCDHQVDLSNKPCSICQRVDNSFKPSKKRRRR